MFTAVREIYHSPPVMISENKKAFLALPLVFLIALGFVLVIGNREWSVIELNQAIYPVALAFGIQGIAFLPAYLLKTEKFYDLVGGLSFIAVVAVSLLISDAHSLQSVVLSLMVALWAGRLSFFLFVRVIKSGKDGRFDAIKQSFPRFLLAWMLQGLWITFTLAPVLAVILFGKGQGIGFAFILGSLLWTFGFAVEVIADSQKKAFKSKSENKGQFIQSGLWSLSRHPNYFGEITLWIGVATIALPLLSGWQYLALSAPVFIFILLRYISGVPMLEKSADQRWGHLESYKTYKNQTPVLLPSLHPLQTENKS